MHFQKQEPFPLLVTPGKVGTGHASWLSHETDILAALGIGDSAFLFRLPVSRYDVMLRRARRGKDKIERVAVGLLGFVSFAFWIFFLVQTGGVSQVASLSYWVSSGNTVLFPLYFAMCTFLFLWYRILVGQDRTRKLPPKGFVAAGAPFTPLSQMADIRQYPRKHTISITDYFSPEALGVFEEAYVLGSREEAHEITPYHLFSSLLATDEIRGLLVRLDISAATVKAALGRLRPTDRSAGDPSISSDVWQILFHAFDEAVRAHRSSVGITELLLATVRQSEPIQEFLYDVDVEEETLTNVVSWIRIRETLREQYHEMRQMGATRNKYGLDRAMTAVATPLLNSLSEDLTMLANYGHLEQCVAREKEIDEIFRVIETGRSNVLLVGEFGTGKKSIVQGIAQRMVSEDVPERLRDKRLIQLSVSSLLAGTSPSGAEERLIRVLREVRRAGNIILFINNLHDLVGVTVGGNQGMDLSGALAEYINSSSVLTLASTTPDAYATRISSSQVGQVFTRVAVEEMSEDQAIQVVESKAGSIEYHQSVFFSYKAIAKSVTFAKQLVHDTPLPASALGLATEAAAYARNKKGQNRLVTVEDIAAVVSEKTGVPTESISSNESEKLLRLEQTLHERIVGQDEAVVLVANALRRARAEVRSQKRPISTFLFLGPTGVGKTELAKTIAEVYFGGEDRMIRIDMSEYQDSSAIYRLIGEPGKEGVGVLTQAVHDKPFSLVLLDELEKADPAILNLFLQVFDDGRLTNSVGKVIDFTNTIIIATSNAGTSYVQDEIKKGTPIEQIHDTLMRSKLKEYYRPEFLNRFDAVVLFKPLERDQVLSIARLLLSGVGKKLEAERGVSLRIEDAALEALLTKGFDPEFGARPMRREIQDTIENGLAELLLSGSLKRRDVVVVGGDLTLHVEQQHS